MVDFNPDAVGNVIRRLRTERKQSQEMISGFAGIARSHLAMIETGTKQPNFKTIWSIANAFEMKPSELVALIEQETQNINQNK